MTNSSSAEANNNNATDRSPIAKSDSTYKNNGESWDKNMGDFYVENGVMKKIHGYNWIVAGLFIVADMAGAGIVALPTSIMKASFYIGIALIFIMAILAAIAAVLLGKAWMIMLRMYPVYRTHCRRPYPEMGYRAMGESMRTIVSVVMLMTQFGVSTTFLLIVSKSAAELLHSITGYAISNCSTITIMAILLLPFTFQHSPKDFWGVICVATLSTIIAVVLIVIGASMDHQCATVAEFPPFGAKRSIMALGVLMFTYGGHAIFPTIQNDMRVPSEFSKSSIFAFILISITNVTVILISGFIYGDSLRSEGVIMSIQTIGIQQASNFFITLHCFLTFPLMVNPMNQEIESFLGILIGFDIRRFFFRTAMVVVIAFTALTVPNFEYFMSLIGGSLIVLTVMVLPAFFYILLSTREQIYIARKSEQANGSTYGTSIKTDDSATYTEISFKEVMCKTNVLLLLLCAIMFFVGLAACIMSTMTAMSEIISLQSDELKPCYWSIFFEESEQIANKALADYNCCGHFQNFSLTRNVNSCTAPDMKFYID